MFVKGGKIPLTYLYDAGIKPMARLCMDVVYRYARNGSTFDGFPACYVAGDSNARELS